MRVIINLEEVEYKLRIKLKKMEQKVWGYLGKSNWLSGVWVIGDK